MKRLDNGEVPFVYHCTKITKLGKKNLNQAVLNSSLLCSPSRCSVERKHSMSGTMGATNITNSINKK